MQTLLVALLTRAAALAITIPPQEALSPEEDVRSTVSITQNASGRLGTLDATITEHEIYLSMPTWKLDEPSTIEAYMALADNWTNKIASVFTHGKEGKLKGLVGQTCRPTYERSRFHSADNAYSDEPTRSYSRQRDHYLFERNISTESQRTLSASEGQAIKSYVEKRLLRD